MLLVAEGTILLNEIIMLGAISHPYLRESVFCTHNYIASHTLQDTEIYYTTNIHVFIFPSLQSLNIVNLHYTFITSCCAKLYDSVTTILATWPRVLTVAICPTATPNMITRSINAFYPVSYIYFACSSLEVHILLQLLQL